MGKLIFIVLFSLACQTHAYELPFKLEKVVGKSFHQAGPNCFATALYGANVYNSFRGVSGKEFFEVIKSTCVKVDEPRFGDIGAYHSKGFGFTHAFVYLDQEAAFEKPGVDYVGKTPIRIQSQSNIDYFHIASPECRRWGDESCYNQKFYYRCGAVSLNPVFEKTLNRVNLLLDQVVQTEVVPLKVQNELNNVYWTLELSAKSDLEMAIFESVQKQMAFFKFDMHRLLIY